MNVENSSPVDAVVLLNEYGIPKGVTINGINMGPVTEVCADMKSRMLSRVTLTYYAKSIRTEKLPDVV